MILSSKSIQALGKIVTGDAQKSPYRSGPELISLFNSVLSKDESYGSDFPSRWLYAESRIKVIHNRSQINQLIKEVFDPRVFHGTQYSLQEAIEYINTFFAFDGLEVSQSGRYYILRDLTDDILATEQINRLNSDYIQEQIIKCRNKIASEDYDGAITNARTLVESSLILITNKLEGEAYTFDGDLVKLYKRVQVLVNLDPSKKDLSDILKQILSGLISIVSGLGALRNKMGDAHSATYKPDRHHAKLAVNAAQTLIEFIVESLEYQQAKH